MTTTYVTADIEEFAAQVRSHLADLGAEEIEELTGGLEADLAEELHERPAGSTLRDPAGYALELRTAAGLPLKVPQKSRPFADFAAGLGQQRIAWAATMRTSSLVAGAMDFAVSMRPAWWILRAWVAYQVVVAFWLGVGGVLPVSLGGWLFLLTSFAVSVQWGRGLWLPGTWMRGFIVAGNVAAILFLLPAAANAHLFYTNFDAALSDADRAMPGISLNGDQVINIFAYDAQGNPLQNVQLFDQSGHPLDSTDMGEQCFDTGCATTVMYFPAQLETGAATWNVFPLLQVPADGTLYNERTDQYEPAEGVKATQPVLPFVKAPAVVGANKPELAPDKAEPKTE